MDRWFPPKPDEGRCLPSQQTMSYERTSIPFNNEETNRNIDCDLKHAVLYGLAIHIPVPVNVDPKFLVRSAFLKHNDERWK